MGVFRLEFYFLRSRDEIVQLYLTIYVAWLD